MKKNKHQLHLKALILFAFVFMTVLAKAQSTNVPLGSPVYHMMDRLEIKSGKFAPFHTSHKSYKRKEVVEFALSVDTLIEELTRLDQTDLEYIFKDNWMYLDKTVALSKEHPKYVASKKKFLKYFYATPSTSLSIGNEDYSLIAQPIFDREIGYETTESNASMTLGQVTGGYIAGHINNRLHFYTDLQIYYDRHQAHVRDFINTYQAIPGNGFYRSGYEAGNIDSLYDYFNSEAYIDFSISKSIDLQFGYGRQFLGNGFRSMYLSDLSNNFLYLRANTNVGVFDYENIFAEMVETPRSQLIGDQVVPKKYYAGHHMSINLLKNLNVGIFEGIVLTRDNGFELNYLNPVLFYRSIERNLGSGDNVFAGLDFKWNFLKRFSMYGQLGIDELWSSQIFIQPNAWAHKFGRQIGIKYIDVLGIDHLDMQLEYNAVRPYTYSHRDSSINYTHNGMALAHPLGANFREFIGILKYQPSSKLYFEARLMQATIGKDTSGTNWGSNVFLNYNTRESDEAFIAQGVSTNIFMFDFWASYMIRHNISFDARLQYRTEDSELDGFDKRQLFYSLGFKYNFWRKRYLF